MRHTWFAVMRFFHVALKAMVSDTARQDVDPSTDATINRGGADVW
jgi:hypothetical protein